MQHRQKRLLVVENRRGGEQEKPRRSSGYVADGRERSIVLSSRDSVHLIDDEDADAGSVGVLLDARNVDDVNGDAGHAVS